MLEQAVSKTNIFDLPSFQMTATVQIDNHGKPLDGTYRMLWNGPEHWSEEINFPGYTELRIGGNGTVWVQRSTGFLPLRVSQLHPTLGFGYAGAGSLVKLGIFPTDSVKKVHSRKQHDDKLTCVEFETELKAAREVCVNESASFGDKDFQPIGAKVFPRSLSFIEGRKKVIKVNISDLTTSGQFPADSFTPPTGVFPEAGCMNPMPPRPIKKVAPQYPGDARQQRIQGTVALDVWIGKDGVPIIGQVVASPSTSLPGPKAPTA